MSVSSAKWPVLTMSATIPGKQSIIAEHVTELQVATAVQHAATASLPFAVPALVGSWYLSVPQVTTFPPHRVVSDSQQVASQPDAAPVHLVVSVTLVFFFFPAEHVTELQVATAVQHAATASLPFVVAALVGSWYLSVPQVTPWLPHRVVSDSQQVAELQLATVFVHLAVSTLVFDL